MKTTLAAAWPPMLVSVMLILLLMWLPNRPTPFPGALTAAKGWLNAKLDHYLPGIAGLALSLARWTQFGNPAYERGEVGTAAEPANITAKRRALGALFDELEAGQKEMAALEPGKEFPKARGEDLDRKAQEAEALQAELDKYDGREAMIAKGREVRSRNLPPDKDDPGGDQKAAVGIAGYVSVGDFVILSKAMQDFAGTNYSRGAHAIVEVPDVSLLGKVALRGERGQPLVPVDRAQRKAIEDLIRTKAVPTIGAGVIEPERLARMPQVTPDDRLNFADVISTGTTRAGSVEYVREESHTQAAAETAHGAEKPEEALEYTNQTAPVRTIAGWMPVQNQQLEDWPQLRSLIDGRLRYSVRRRREYQIAWGNGQGSNLEGLLTVAGTIDIAANNRFDASAYAAGDQTLIDVVRMGITDVLVAGYEPNFVAIHPFDWEKIILTKGSDQHYVWIIVTDDNGSRLWSLRVIETVAMQERAGNAVEARELIVGDGQMGAQILDRMQLSVMVGLINDQLIRNMRTILAEERLAFPIYAPAAFAHFETQASST